LRSLHGGEGPALGWMFSRVFRDPLQSWVSGVESAERYPPHPQPLPEAVKNINGRDALLRVREGRPNTDTEYPVHQADGLAPWSAPARRRFVKRDASRLGKRRHVAALQMRDAEHRVPTESGLQAQPNVFTASLVWARGPILTTATSSEPSTHIRHYNLHCSERFSGGPK